MENLELEKKEFERIKALADQGDSVAQCQLGNYYYNSEVVEQDYKKAFELFNLSFKKDDKYIPTLVNLGNCYYYGHGVEQDYEKASKLYRLAANQKNMKFTDTDWYLFVYYLEQIKKGAKILRKPMHKKIILKKAIKNVKKEINSTAKIDPSNISFIKTTFYETKEQLFESCKNETAFHTDINLGICYYKGIGTIRNYKEAYRYFLHAVANNPYDGVSTYYLAKCFECGHGIKKDYEYAYRYYIQASRFIKKKTRILFRDPQLIK